MFMAAWLLSWRPVTLWTYKTVSNIPQVTYITLVTYVTHGSNIVTCGMLMAVCLLSWCPVTLWSSQMRCYKAFGNTTQVTHVTQTCRLGYVDGCVPAELVPGDIVELTGEIVSNY
jgi:hypothetical protein